MTAELADKGKAIWQRDAAVPAETSTPVVEDESIGTVEVIANELNIRSGPSIDAPVVNTAWKGSTFDVFLEQDGWLKIGEDEWISGKAQYAAFVPIDEQAEK
ncbi:Bacterial SH3 domain protein [compost metagenome]